MRSETPSQLIEFVNQAVKYMNRRRAPKLRYALLPLLVLMAANMSYAGNLSFLKDSAIAKFDDEDVRLLMEAVTAVLSDTAAPTKRQWRNERTGHFGELRTSSMLLGRNGVSCKRLRVVNHAGTRKSKATYTMCNIPPDGWRLVPSDFVPASNKPKP